MIDFEWIKKVGEGYRQEKQFSLFFNSVQIMQADDEEEVVVWVTPWMGMPVFYYEIALGVLLVADAQKKVRFLINDVINNPVFYKYQKYEIYRIKQFFKKNSDKFNDFGIQFEFLSFFINSEIKIENEDILLMKRYAHLNAIKMIGNSIPSEEFSSTEGKIFCELEKAYKGIKYYVEKHLDDKVCWGIVSQGLYCETGIVYELFKNTNRNIVTFDGESIMALNGIATHVDDAIECVIYLLNNNLDNDSKIRDSFKALEARMSGKKEVDGQLKGLTIFSENNGFDFEEEYILIVPNCEVDSHALNCHRAFGDDFDWLVNTIDYILENTEISIIVREHPLQRKIYPFVKVTVEQELARLYCGNSRVKILLAEEPANTYKLVEKAKMVLVCSSDIGVEATMIGKHVITEAESSYSVLDVVDFAPDKEKYYSMILDALANMPQFEIKKNTKEVAALYNLMVRKYFVSDSEFRPMPNNFTEWTKKGFEWLRKEELAKEIVHMFKTGESVMLQRVKKGLIAK